MNNSSNKPSSPSVSPEKLAPQRIAQLNDALRKTHTGGKVMLTHSVNSLDRSLVQQAIQMMADFNQFSQDNDPYGEHDFGSFSLGDYHFNWKIDYYSDTNYQYGSEDPSNPEKTARVLTLMLRQDY